MSKKEEQKEQHRARQTFTIKADLYQRLKEEAERERRPLSNLLNLILEDRYKPKK